MNIVIAIVVLAAAVASAPVLATAQTADAIYACVQKSSREVRIVGASEPCRATETRGRSSSVFAQAPGSPATAGGPAGVGGAGDCMVVMAVPNTIVSMTVNPTALPPGSSATGTITLGMAAVGDITVRLSSGSTDRLTVAPACVIVRNQTTSATFTATALPAAAPGDVPVTAKLWSNETKQVTVTISARPPRATNDVRSVVVRPDTVVRPGTSTGTVTLAQAAGRQGVTVDLASSAPASVTVVPATLRFEAGATTATFTAAVAATAAAGPVVITAKVPGSARAGQKTVLTVTVRR